MSWKQYISIGVGLCFFAILMYQIVKDVRDNFENKEEDKFVLSLVEDVKKIHPSVEKIIPHLKFFEGRKSYTINKTYVHICKKDKNGQLYHRNQLILVLLHEIAHTLCDEVGHPPKFYTILDELLLHAEKAGIYNPNIPHIPEYCEY